MRIFQYPIKELFKCFGGYVTFFGLLPHHLLFEIRIQWRSSNRLNNLLSLGIVIHLKGCELLIDKIDQIFRRIDLVLVIYLLLRVSN